MLCLGFSGLSVALLASGATLAWTHSVEKTLWEEDWRATPSGIELVEARVRGSGAGMEPPPEARFVNGAWAWRPAPGERRELVMRRSGATADWRICVSGECRPLAALVPPEADPVVLKRCD